MKPVFVSCVEIRPLARIFCEKPQLSCALRLNYRLKLRILIKCDLVGEQGAAPSMTPLVVMVVDEDHGMLGVSHAPTLVVHASQLTKLLPSYTASNLTVRRTKYSFTEMYS
jgi:hypothetical protein